MLATLKMLGVRSLHRQLAWLATCSFFSGLAQASLLVLVSEFAVNSAKGKNHLQVHGYSLSISDAVFLSATTLDRILASQYCGRYEQQFSLKQGFSIGPKQDD